MQEHIRIHEKDVDHYAGVIAEKMAPGVPVLLHGPVGVGKSTFARAVLRTLMPDLVHIPSPSFPIVIPYAGAVGKIWHMDLYRIEKQEDIAPLGLEEMMAQDRCLIEWPDRLDGLMPQRYIAVGLDFVDPGFATFGSGAGEAIKNGLETDLEHGVCGNLYRFLSIQCV